MNRNTALDALMDPATIRERTRRIFELGQEGGTSFSVHLEKLPKVVDFVLEVTRENYPDGRIPYHGRFEHFRAGGIDRIAALQQELEGLPPLERARTLVDLVVVSSAPPDSARRPRKMKAATPRIRASKTPKSR